MSYQDAWAAINLQMPGRVPRTEYSADRHWELVKAVTGIDVGPLTPQELQDEASRAFRAAWSYDFYWDTLMSKDELEGLRTDMGHAEYAAGGTDRRDTTYCPFSEPEEVLRFDPWQAYGQRDQAELIRRFQERYHSICRKYPEELPTTGIYITMISGLLEIFGWDMMLLAHGTSPERFGDMANRYASWIQQYFDALAKTDVRVVMVHDDIVWSSGAFVHPEWYRKYVFPNYRKYLAPLIDSGKRIVFTSDGNFTQFIDDIAECGVHGFCMEPMTDMSYIAEKYGQTHFFIGNADTRVLLSGTKPQIRAEVERCMTIGKKCPGFFMAVGNHIPANTPVENALYYDEVYRELSRR